MWEIRFKYPGQPWETIDEADSKQDAEYLLHEYRMAYGPECRVTMRRSRK